jgi:hypothetical protein
MRIALTTSGSRAYSGIPSALSHDEAISPDKDQLMKTTVFAICFLCATAAAFGQTASVQSNNPQPIYMPDDRPQHASQHVMALESSLLSTSEYSYAQGEQPMSDFVTLKRETPLGDIARAYRKEHVMAPKAVVVLDK